MWGKWHQFVCARDGKEYRRVAECFLVEFGLEKIGRTEVRVRVKEFKDGKAPGKDEVVERR